MRLMPPPTHAIVPCLRAMKMVATEERPLSAAATNMLAGAQRFLLGSAVPLASLEPIAPEELAAALTEPALRRQFIMAMLMLTLSDGPPSPAQMDLVEAFAASLDVGGAELRTIRLLADKHTVLFRLHFLRHSHLGEVAARGIQGEGLLAPIKGLLGMRGLYEDPALAARYRALEKLREGTLGHAFTVYIHDNKFAYPGDKHGFPEIGIWHDFGHVLSGYRTDPEGELEMVGFQAGYRKNNAFFMLLFGALTFSAGINVTPLPQPDTRGILAREGLVERIWRAMDRGARMTVDLFEDWDPWAHVELPLEEARTRFNILPA